VGFVPTNIVGTIRLAEEFELSTVEVPLPSSKLSLEVEVLIEIIGPGGPTTKLSPRLGPASFFQNSLSYLIKLCFYRLVKFPVFRHIKGLMVRSCFLYLLHL